MTPPGPVPLVSVIIPTFNRLASLQTVLRALFGQSVPQDAIEIIVVDNSSTDGTKEWIDGLRDRGHGNVATIRMPPTGPAPARNAGLAAARGDYALFLDSDVELEADWIERAVAALRDDPRLGAVGGLVAYAHSPELTNALGGVLSVLGYCWDYGEGQPRDSMPSLRSCLWINCSAMLIRTAAARAVGGFDSEFYYGYEDSDLGWRICLAGYRIEAHSSLVAIHHVNPAAVPSDPKFVFHYTKNRLRSVLKNYNAWHALLYGGLGAAVTLADAVTRRPRAAKWRALVWNLTHLPETLRARRAIQALRVIPDSQLRSAFESRWFPEARLDGRRRRPTDPRRPPATLELGRDDRV